MSGPSRSLQVYDRVGESTWPWGKTVNVDCCLLQLVMTEIKGNSLPNYNSTCSVPEAAFICSGKTPIFAMGAAIEASTWLTYGSLLLFFRIRLMFSKVRLVHLMEV